MSSRALRRLKGNPRGQEALQAGDPELETGEEEEETQTEPAKNTSRKAKKNKKQKNICNIYELINEAENETDKNCEVEAPAEEDHVESKLDPDNQEKEKSDNEETEKQEETRETEKSSVSVKASKKKKKKKNKKTTAGDAQEEGYTDDIDSILETIENQNGLSYRNECSRNADTRPILYVEHRNLNPETELKRYFGARAVLGDQSRPRQRQRQFHRSTWMTTLKNTWPRFSKPGISMSLLETRDGVQYFTFEHSREYQQVQFKFLDAVESMDPNNIVLLLQMNPYHIDSLLQLSDVCRIQDDQEMAKDLIERALYSFECASHPVFSLTSGTSRLDYLRPENRAFYLSLYKHMMFLEKRGCPRTALEYCKLILSLDPDNDPLCMLLLLDFLSLRSREYSFLSRIYEEWEAHRNLSQLPNFAYSVGLCYYFLSQQEDLPAAECAQKQQTADHLLQNALLMFPSVLMPLLEICAVEPDAAVSSHAFFGPRTQIGQPPALNELVALFVGRSHSLWKDPAVMLWLERNVKEVLQRVDANDPVVEEYEKKRKLRYQSAPRSIHRHVILSEIKEATAALPLEVTAQPVMGFDPLPPLDSVVSYTRPERANRVATDESTLSLFLRSLLPNFNLQGGVRPEEDLEVAHAGRQLNQEVNRLMGAMRDMLANIQFQEPPREDNPERDEEEWD